MIKDIFFKNIILKFLIIFKLNYLNNYKLDLIKIDI